MRSWLNTTWPWSRWWRPSCNGSGEETGVEASQRLLQAGERPVVGKKPKRRKRPLQTEVPLPVHDWVYACARGLATPEIAAALSVEGRPVTEVPARTWQEDGQMANSFLEAYGCPQEW